MFYNYRNEILSSFGFIIIVIDGKTTIGDYNTLDTLLFPVFDEKATQIESIFYSIVALIKMAFFNCFA